MSLQVLFWPLLVAIAVPVNAAGPLCDTDGYVKSEFVDLKVATRHRKADAVPKVFPIYSSSSNSSDKILPAFSPNKHALVSLLNARAVSVDSIRLEGLQIGSEIRLDRVKLTGVAFNGSLGTNYRPVEPELGGGSTSTGRLVIIDGKPQTLPYVKAPAKSCKSAVQRLVRSEKERDNLSILTSASACALLSYERECLSTQPPPMINYSIAQRSIVALTFKGEAWCMGILDFNGSETSLITARHCFINPKTGTQWNFPRLRSGETLDGQRTFSIEDAAIASLSTSAPYNVSVDAVRIPIKVTTNPGALALPVVRWKMDAPDNTAVWVPGAVMNLLEATEMNTGVETGLVTTLNWRQSIRWGIWLNGDSRISHSEDGCRYYRAQTWQGFSGAPVVLSASDQDIVVSGVHSGAADIDGTAWSPCGTSELSKKLSLTQNLGDAEIN